MANAANAVQCPDENTLGAFVEGVLDEEETKALEDHVDGCHLCHELMSAYATAHGATAPAPMTGEPVTDATTHVRSMQHARPLGAGTHLGRYVVLGWVGEGGAGSVYAAYDPELDRKVAIKLLHPRDGEDPLASTLLREARAMAKLAHPEVVGVHDVGVLGGRVFVAMEFVHGTTLRAWCTEKRTTKEIVAAYVAAGRGLAAAHSVGLVHRDFKPENVLVGEDGRVRVSDFGLARELGSEAPPAPSSSAASLAPTSTGAGAQTAAVTNPHAGTPAYMAPEQRRGEHIDARTDQYAFCVSLEEALLVAAARSSGAFPSRLRKIVTRGRSDAPSARYPSMAELLADIESDPARRWRRALVAMAAIVTVGSVAFGAYSHVRGGARPLCTGGDQLLTGVWDAPRKQAVATSFSATGKPFAADAWRGIERAIDGYTQDWVKTRTSVCEATHVRGEQSPLLLDTRMACLDDRLIELRALTDLFVNADADIVTNALSASESLGRPSVCASARSIEDGRANEGAAALARATDVRARLASLKALDDAGKYKDGLVAAADVVARAKSTGRRGLEGEALLRYGNLQGRAGDLDAAETTLNHAASAADGAGDDRTRARAESALIFFVGSEQAKFAQVEAYRAVAVAAIDRLGGDDRLQADLARSLGAALSAQGKLEDAQVVDEQALALVEKLYGADSRDAAYAMNNLGLTCLFRGDSDRALSLFTRSLSVGEKVLGAYHPMIGNIQNSIGLAYGHIGESAKAEQAFRRSLEVCENALGPDHPRVANALEGVGGMMLQRGEAKSAIPLLERAQKIREERLRPDHPSLFYTHRNLGRAYLGVGRNADAIAHLSRAVALSAGIGDSDVAVAEFALAEAMSATGTSDKTCRALVEKAKTRMAGAATGREDDIELAKMTAWLATKHGK